MFKFGSQNNYFQIKLSKFSRKDKDKVMLQFIDISKSILYEMEKSHNAVLSMINACVSHEMRNPLNSIIAQNYEKKEIYSEISQLVKDFKANKIEVKDFLKKHDSLMSKLDYGMKI